MHLFTRRPHGMVPDPGRGPGPCLSADERPALVGAGVVVMAVVEGVAVV